MKLYRTAEIYRRIPNASYVEHEGNFYFVPIERWDAIVNHPDLAGFLVSLVARTEPVEAFDARKVIAPVETEPTSSSNVPVKFV